MATFLVVFRETLEAALMVGILLSYVFRMDHGRYAKWIYVGVVSGLVASAASALAFQVAIDQFNSDRYRACLNAGIMLTATAVLSYMTIWMQRQARAHTARSLEQLEAYIDGQQVAGIVLLSFISVWREGLETILFLSALETGDGLVPLAGGAVGAVAAVVMVWLLMTGTRGIPIKAFFRHSSLLLIIIAAGLLGSAIGILQGLKVLPMLSEPRFDLSAFLSDTGVVGGFLRGLFGYNATPTVLQFEIWALYLLIAIMLWSRSYADENT